MVSKPSIPKGTRDFSPEEMVRRNFIFDTIKSVFRRFGFQQLETPSMENLSTLMGKYGEEGDKLLFRVLNSGDFLQSVQEEDWQQRHLNKVSSAMCEKGLRYDLTVPFARYVVQHQSEISFPFKRFQIQPVWRADRPQKGRYREFFQCDADVVGSRSLLIDAELIQMVEQVFAALHIGVTVKLNNRKILSGIAELIGAPEQVTDLTVAIDKLDKIGIQQVNEELLSKGFSSASVESLQPILALSGTNLEKMAQMETLFAERSIATGLAGVKEMQEVFEYLSALQVGVTVEMDLSLARGLNYYTGTILEVKANDVTIGSICGGGRYDNLTGIFGLPNLSGVGISFGAYRIYDVLTQLQAFPDDSGQTTKLLFINFGEEEVRYALPLLNQVRAAGSNAEVYPEPAKMKKQMTYADNKHIAFVAMIGSNEQAEGKVSLKNMITGAQTVVLQSELISALA